MAKQLPTAPSEVRDWLRKNAIPLATPEAGRGFRDLRPLKKVIGDVRLVSLGEATHGTREFFQIKHRMFEFLATEMGFTIFAIEASFPECLAINEYVTTGTGDPAAVLAGQRFWTWDTHEVLDLIRWMRRFNEDPRNQRKLSFYGFDMQFPPVGAQSFLDYLARVDPLLAFQAEKTLAPLTTDFNVSIYGSLPGGEREKTREGIVSLLRRFRSRKAIYVRRSSEKEWELALRNLVVVKQGEEMYADPANFAIRDRAMADNAEALLDLGGPDSKAVLWAHNGHVQLAPWGGGIQTMGTHLKRKFGDRHVVFGFAFGHGSFQAIDMDRGGLRNFRVGAPPPASLDAVFSEIGPLFIIDLAKVPRRGPVADWFASDVGSRGTGAVWSIKRAEKFFGPARVRERYNALIFVRETSAARRNAAGRRPATSVSRTRKLLPRPANLDLSRGKAGGTPTGWRTVGGRGKWRSYSLALIQEGPRTTKRSVEIAREWAPWTWGQAELTQTFHARLYRGNRVRLSALVRTEVAQRGAEAQLFIRVDPKPKQDPPLWLPAHPLRFVGMHQSPIRSSEWREYEISTRIPKRAETITIGLVFTGNGRALVSDFSFRKEE